MRDATVQAMSRRLSEKKESDASRSGRFANRTFPYACTNCCLTCRRISRRGEFTNVFSFGMLSRINEIAYASDIDAHYNY